MRSTDQSIPSHNVFQMFLGTKPDKVVSKEIESPRDHARYLNICLTPHGLYNTHMLVLSEATLQAKQGSLVIQQVIFINAEVLEHWGWGEKLQFRDVNQSQWEQDCQEVWEPFLSRCSFMHLGFRAVRASTVVYRDWIPHLNGYLLIG